VKVLPLLIVGGSPDYHPAAKAKIATLLFDCLRPMTLRTDIDDFTANRVPVVIRAIQRGRSASAGFALHVAKNVTRAALVAWSDVGTPYGKRPTANLDSNLRRSQRLLLRGARGRPE
jgi:hypothetical protein